MKPLWLRMQAFGSYVYQEIDFCSLKQNLFLVTGDTGAGKTTIFDAITFALYGNVSSGTNKKGYGDIWSQYAESGRKPCVELCFSEKKNGKAEIYKVSRLLNYTASQGFGQRVALTMPDGEDYKGNVKEINKRISEIVGLDKSQFMQVAMIAQGEFMELLRIDDADGKEKKKEIFRKLFNTGIYEKIVGELKSRKDAKDKEVSDIRGICRACVARADCKDSEETAEIRQRIISEKTPSDSDIMNFSERLGILNKITAERLVKTESETAEARETYSKAHDNHVRAVEIKGHFDKLKQAERVLAECRKSETEIKNSETLMKNIISAHEIKAVYDRYSETEKNLSETENSLKKLTENLPKLLTDCNNAQNSEKALQEEFNSARDIYNKVSEAVGFYREVVNQRNTAEKARKAYAEARERYSGKNSEYNEKYRIFLDAQAGFMARELKDGEPCPVCGSTEHPRPCGLDKNTNLTREDIDSLKAETDRLREIQEKKATEARSSADRLADMEKTTAYGSEKEAEDALRNARNAMDEKDKSHKKAVLETRKAEKQRTEAETLIKKYTEEVPELKNELEKRRTACTEITAEKGLDEWQETAVSYTKAYAEELKRKIDRYNREKYNAEGGYRQAKKAVENKEVPDIESLENAEKTAREILEKATEKLDGYKNILRNNSGIYKELTGISENLVKLGRESEMLNSLYMRLSGKQSNNKLSLETFVQRKHLRRILANANRHFLEMSAGQFELHLKNDEDASSGRRDGGLDLMVYSAVTDTEREVKTLSGGESFMGALSLALGMAEQIQANSSAVNLDMMFIDEGFGSLDEHSRKQAVNVLKELAGGERLTGIISHVSEMKNEIDSHLVVTRDENGSHAEWHIS